MARSGQERRAGREWGRQDGRVALAGRRRGLGSALCTLLGGLLAVF